MAFTAGAVTLTAAVAVGTAVTVIRSTHSADSGYCALMPDAVGLYVGNPVTQMGYHVGKVDRIEPQGAQVRVTFQLDSGRSYPADVKAVTRSKSILADRSLELVGSYGSGAKLERGNCIALRNTATPKSLSEITGSAADFIDHVAPDGDNRSVADAVDGLSRALAGQGGNTHQLMIDAQSAMAGPDRMVGDIGSIIFALAPLTDQAVANWGAIRHIAEVLPTDVTSLTYGAWPGVDGLIRGMGPLIQMLYEIQARYGGDIWPLADRAADAIHFAATRAEDIRGFLAVLPGVAAFLGNTAKGDGVRWQPPTVNGTNVLDLTLAKENK
ncbi:MlaD family protein [Nocardia sp. NPDC004123]